MERQDVPPTQPTPPEPPKLQPLAPVSGPAISQPKGFPFHQSGEAFSFKIDTDADGKSADSNNAQMFELVTAITLTAIVFTCPILLIGVILIYRQRKNKLMHQSIQGFVEKGLPIPPELLAIGGKTLPTPKSDRRKGLMLSCIGVGLVFFFLANGNDSWGVGFIPLGIGIGYLLTSKFAPRGVDLP